MVNRRQVKEYTKWLAQTIQKESLTTQEMVKILDGQLQLPERLMNGELIRKCRLSLYPKIHGDDVPGKQETMERVHTFLQKENKAKEEGDIEKKRFHLRPAAFVACLLLLVMIFGVSINAVGFNIWRLIFHWDDETMEMEIAMQGQIKGSDYEFYSGQAYVDAFYQRLAEMEMKPLLPSWMPDDFVLGQVEGKIETEYLRWASGIYTYDEREFKISIVKKISEKSGGSLSLQKDEREPEIFEQGGIKFYIMDNLSRSHAFWFDPPYRIDISGHVTRDELRQMINSMFERSISK